MEFAIVDGLRTSPTSAARATCPQCFGEVLAKCGQINVHHWAHVVGEDCDPWSEPETPWHRHWKSFGYRTEVTFAGHRADIVTSPTKRNAEGLIIELQHSGISLEDICAREACYGARLRWLFDGTSLPVRAPNGHLLCAGLKYDGADYEWEEEDEDCRYITRYQVIDGPYGLTKQRFVNASEYDEDEDSSWISVGEPRLCLRSKGTTRTREGWKVVTFRWKHPRKHYGYTSRPTYIDLPGNFVLKLGKLHLESGAPYGGWGSLVPRATVEGWLR